MITGNLKWRAQDRRRCECYPPMLIDFDAEFLAVAEPRPGTITSTRAPRTQFIPQIIPAWRHVRA